MSVPMLELAPQNAAVKAKVLEGLSGLIDRSAFILGENVKGLEAEISTYVGAAHAVAMSSGVTTPEPRPTDGTTGRFTLRGMPMV